MSPSLPVPRIRREIGWELVVCGWRGHELVGTDAAELRPEDDPLAREYDGARWYRCLRCDTWVPLPPPAQPARRHPPERAEIAIPARGQALRDKIVLRLIAVDRAIHFLVLGSLGIVVLILAGENKGVRGRFTQVLTDLQRAFGGGPVQSSGHVGIFGELDKLFSLRAHTLHLLATALLAYGVLEGVEAIGLWRMKRWAEYLTFLATTILLPLEIYEIVHKVSALKVIGFALNLAIVIYLLFRKRLFGLRGGGRVDEARRAAAMSWHAIDAATPPGARVRA